jgi:hypothetical protein
MPYRKRPKHLRDPEPWPTLPVPWWRDLKGTPTDPPEAPVVQAVGLLVLACVYVALAGWAEGLRSLYVFGVILAGASLLGGLFARVWFGLKLSKGWFVAKLVIVTTFYGMCGVAHFTKLAIITLALSVLLFVFPLAVVAILGGLKRDPR